MSSLALVDIATRINAEHAAAMEHARNALQRARAAGELLIQAKQRCPHGGWLPWLAKYCPDISERTVQGYMRLARHYLDYPERAAALESLTLRDALARLAQPNPRRVADLPPWHGEDISWLPADDTMMCAEVERAPGADGGILYVQQSAQNPGYFHMLQMFEPVYPGEQAGIHGMSRPVLAEAASFVFRKAFKRVPATLEWQRVPAAAGHLDKIVADWLPAPWLIEHRNSIQSKRAEAQVLV